MPFPRVELIRPGLWSIPVPLPMSSLRYVYVYVFEATRGAYIVDTGWNTQEAYSVLTSGLESVGFHISDVKGVIVTHIHPDHYGLAGRIREASGAWVALHPADAALIHERYEDPESLLEEVRASLRRLDAPVEQIETLASSALGLLPLMTPAQPNVLVEDRERVDVPGWDLVSLWTPGHSPGHICLWEPRNRLMLSGDHVLPRITPNISLHPQSGIDPLGEYLSSLQRVAEFDADEVLPAHEYRFEDLAGRVNELIDHHERRFAEALYAILNGVDTAWQIAERLTWSRPWDETDWFMRRAAAFETFAHLRALSVRGILRELSGEPYRWLLAESSDGSDVANLASLGASRPRRT